MILYSEYKDVQEIGIKIKAAFVKVLDLDININNFLLLILLNNLGPNQSQYRTVLNNKIREKDRLEFNDVLKGLKDYKRTIKIDPLLNQVKS